MLAGRTFWAAQRLLVDLGLLDRVAALLEGPDDEAEVIHSLGYLGGESLETRLAEAAQRAACSLLTDQQNQTARALGYVRLVPVLRHMTEVCIEEVYRLVASTLASSEVLEGGCLLYRMPTVRHAKQGLSTDTHDQHDGY